MAIIKMHMSILPILEIELHQAYYGQGFFNVGVDFERHFGENGTPVLIKIQRTGASIIGEVNRTANMNATPRIMGGPKLKRYFQANYKEGDIVQFMIVSQDVIELVD